MIMTANITTTAERSTQSSKQPKIDMQCFFLFKQDVIVYHEYTAQGHTVNQQLYLEVLKHHCDATLHKL